MITRWVILSGIVSILWALGSATAWAKETTNEARVGKASWYGKNDTIDPFKHRFNADGSAFNENALTCAMRKRNFGSYYKITNLNNGKSVIVKHRDYGPGRTYRGKRLNRIVDLSKAAFMRLADLKSGVIRVKVERAKDLGKGG